MKIKRRDLCRILSNSKMVNKCSFPSFFGELFPLFFPGHIFLNSIYHHLTVRCHCLPPLACQCCESRDVFSLASSTLNHTWYTVQKYFQNICWMNECVCDNLSFTLQPFLWTAASLIDLFACTYMS